MQTYAIFILLSIKTRIETKQILDCHGCQEVFLSYYPLKQGLKLRYLACSYDKYKIFILLSIKTRIETMKTENPYRFSILFLSYYPLKQGLKQSFNSEFFRQ